MENEKTNFTIIKAFEKYDKHKNQLKLSVYDLLPIGIKWNYNGKEYTINNGNKIEALLLKDNKNISIIEEPYSIIKNKAYIIDGNSKTKYNIKGLLLENKNFISEYKVNKLYIYEAHYIDNELYYFININEFDYRFIFNIEDGNYDYKELIFLR